MSTTVTENARPAPSGGGLRGLVAAEWTKLWSVRATWWSLAGALGLMILYTVSIGFDMSQPPERADEMARADLILTAGEAALGGLTGVQFVVLALGVLAVTTEYSTGSIRSTLQWDPRRSHLVLAKTLVLAPVTLVAGSVIGLVGGVLGYLTAGEYGAFDAANDLADVARIGVYCAAVTTLAVGLSLLLRSTAGVLTTLFMLLLLAPMLLQATGLDAMGTVAEYLPGSAGMQFLGAAGSIGMSDLPYGRSAGLAILSVWAVAALAAGYAVLRRRDA